VKAQLAWIAAPAKRCAGEETRQAVTSGGAAAFDSAAQPMNDLDPPVTRRRFAAAPRLRTGRCQGAVPRKSSRAIELLKSLGSRPTTEKRAINQTKEGRGRH
jgi:hypothetical protein